MLESRLNYGVRVFLGNCLDFTRTFEDDAKKERGWIQHK